MRVIIDVRSLLRNIPIVTRELQDNIRQEMILTALTDVESKAKDKITKDEHIDTGRLRASIHTEYYGHTGNNYSDLEENSFDGSLITQPRPQYFDVLIGTNVEYAQKIERLDSYLVYALERSKPEFRRRLKNIIIRGSRSRNALRRNRLTGLLEEW